MYDFAHDRHIFRLFYQGELDRVKVYQASDAYQKAMRKRSLWTEPLFGEVKQFHQLRQFRLGGLKTVNIEGVMVAAGQNIKRFIKQSSNEHFSFFKLALFVRLFPYSFDFFNKLKRATTLPSGAPASLLLTKSDMK